MEYHMKKIVKALENIGQKSTIKQFKNIKQMQDKVGLSDKMLTEIEKIQADLVCSIQPSDDD